MPNRISKNKKQSVVKAREDDFVQAGARGELAAEYLAEMKGLLDRFGYDPEHAVRLQREGMGSFELEYILRSFKAGAMGSLDYTHGFRRLAAVDSSNSENRARSHTERIALDIVSWVLADGKFASSSRTLAHFGLPEWVDGGRIREVVAAAFGPDGRGREWAIEQIASILRSVYRRQKADRR